MDAHVYVGFGLSLISFFGRYAAPQLPRHVAWAGAAAGTLVMSVPLWGDGMKPPAGTLVFTVAGFICFGIAAYLFAKRSDEPKAAIQITQPASLLFEWKWSKLPTAIPASGTVWTMSNISESELGGRPLLLSPRPGTVGDKLTWSEDTRQYGGVYRCDITNYADYPIFNLAMNFRTEFFKPEPDGGRKAETPVAESYDRPVTINKLDPKETFSFYAYSDSRMFVSVSLPKTVTYLRDDQSQRETARLLPQAEQSITLFPMTLIEQRSIPTSQGPLPDNAKH